MLELGGARRESHRPCVVVVFDQLRSYDDGLLVGYYFHCDVRS